jgi:SAM-dependent methyltransferase
LDLADILGMISSGFMAISPRPQVELEKTYNAAADHYDHPAVSFWDRYGRRTVERLPLVSGMAVLDVCCGMGASAIPAAERVGPAGHVIAVDLIENLLNKGSQRARKSGLTNIEFRRADLESLPFPDRAFDALLCVFGIFFVTDVQERSESFGVWSARMGCLRSPFGVAACSNRPTAHSGKQSAVKIQNSMGQSNQPLVLVCTRLLR